MPKEPMNNYNGSQHTNSSLMFNGIEGKTSIFEKEMMLTKHETQDRSSCGNKTA